MVDASIAHKVVGYFSHSPKLGVFCDGDACIIASTEGLMHSYIQAMMISCAIKKSAEEIEKAHKKVRQKASKNGGQVSRLEMFEFSKYFVVFTTFPEASFNAQLIMQLYRLRWQIELVFKRLKSIVRLGHLPKYDDASCRAWSYGKLFMGLLTEKLARIGRAFSP